ncbi:hypothetical protein FCV25MIE_22166 [Fagus crenata]
MLSEEARADIRNRISRFISNDEWKMTCGLLVHEERNCEKQSKNEGSEPPQYGEQLKASFGGKMMGVHGFEGYGSGKPKNKEMDHGGKHDITTEDNALITKSMESTAVVGGSNHTEEESDRGRAVSEPINEGKEGCLELGGRRLDSVRDTRAITKEEKEGEWDRGCQANETNFPSRGLVLLGSLLFVKVDFKPIIGEAATYVEQCKPDMERDNIDKYIEET